jgi:hypothetical protein
MRAKYKYNISTIEFSVGGFEGSNNVVFSATEDGADVTVRHVPSFFDTDMGKPFHISQGQWQKLISELIDQLHVTEWEKEYVNMDIMDGTQWSLTVSEGESVLVECYGSNEYPPQWDKLRETLSDYSMTEL